MEGEKGLLEGGAGAVGSWLQQREPGVCTSLFAVWYSGQQAAVCWDQLVPAGLLGAYSQPRGYSLCRKSLQILRK